MLIPANILGENMTQIIIEIPNEVTQRVLDGIAYRLRYSPELEDGSPNPETKAKFAKRKLVEYMKKLVREAEIEIARNDAADVAAQSVDDDVVIS